jgi:hypothetical protein
MPRKRNTNNNTQSNAAALRQIASLKRSLAGHANIIRNPDPTPVNRRPFYPLVVAQTYVSTGAAVEITTKAIVTSLLDQLQLAAQTATIVIFKLQRVDCYAVSKADSSVRPSVSVDFSSLIASLDDPTTPTGPTGINYPKIARLNDIGGVSTAASVSYTWPQHMRAMPLTGVSQFTVFEFATNMTELDCRIHLMWSTLDIAPPY